MGRCKICSTLTKQRKQAASKSDKMQIAEHHWHHIQNVKADSEHLTRTIHIAAEHAINPSPDGENQLLRFTIDGMDQLPSSENLFVEFLERSVPVTLAVVSVCHCLCFDHVFFTRLAILSHLRTPSSLQRTLTGGLGLR